MSQLDSALILRMEATLSKFEKQMARAKKAGTSTATDLEQRFANSNRKMSQNAEQSANAIGREMDRLRAKYDPVYAASKRYEAALEELTQAQKLGAINTVQYEAALERLNAEYTQQVGVTQRAAVATTQTATANARATTSANALAAANTRVTRGTRGMSGGIQNASYQVADFAVQVGAGTAASVALGQQIPQLLAGFGVLGAVLGAVAAIGLPLAAVFFRSGEGAEDLEEKARDLEKAVRDYRSAAESAIIPTADLAEKYGTATEAARVFIATMQEITRVNALTALEDSLDGIADRFGKLSDQDGDLQRQVGTFVGRYAEQLESRSSMPDPQMAAKVREILNANAALSQIAATFDITFDKAGQIAGALADAANADGPEEALEAAQSLLKALEAALGPYEKMNDEAKKLYEETANVVEAAADVVGTTGNIAPNLSNAASEAGRLADELGRAVNNAISLAAQGISDVSRAKIEYEFRDDPVARAGALARARFDEQTALPSDADSTIQNVIEADRREFVGAAIAAEEYRQKLIDYRKEQAEIGRSSGRSGGGGKSKSGGGRSARAEEPLFGASDAEMQSIERQIEAIGKTRSEIVALEAKYRLLDEAKERGLNLDARYADSSETLAQEIERQSEAIGQLSETYDQASTKADFFAQQQADLRSGMLDVIMEGESLKGVLGGVAKAFARAALEAGFFNKGPMATGGGGGLLGSLFSGIMGALPGRAAGGPVIAGKGYRINENSNRGSEPFFPAVSGRILSTQQAQEAMRGEGSAQRIKVDVRLDVPQGVTVDEVRRVAGDVSVNVMKRDGPGVVVSTLRNTGNRGLTSRVVR